MADKSAPTNRERLWTAMRELRHFTVADLSMSSEVANYSTIGSYCATLSYAGYLQVLNPGRRNRRWQLLLHMDTGPLAPKVLAGGREVYDPNLERRLPDQDTETRQ